MLFRGLIVGVLLTGAALGWFIAAGPSITLGLVKNDFVDAYEKAGIDVSACKDQRTLINPSGGMEKCMQGVYKDIQRQITEIDAADQAPGVGEEQPAEEPSLE